MSVYDKSGNVLQTVYGKNGQALAAVYSKDGEQIFPDGPISLKVMEYNIGGWYDGSGQNVPADKDQQYYELQYGTIADNDPDILMMNEYWDTFSKAGRTALSFLSTLFPYIYSAGGTTQYFGRCFCSKYPLSGYVSHVYAGQSQRYYDTIIANIAGQNVTLCVTHLGLTVADRQTQAAELLSFLQSLQTPFIMAGDLNTASSATTEGEDYINVIKPLIDAGYQVANCGEFGRHITYKDTVGTKGQGSLDNIVFSPQFTITSVSVDDRKLSDQLEETADHMPLIATAEFEP